MPRCPGRRRTPSPRGRSPRRPRRRWTSAPQPWGSGSSPQPEPWVMRHLGPPPREAKPGLQALLQADYARRAGIAAGLPGSGRDHRPAPGHPVGRAQGEPGTRSHAARRDLAPCRSATSKPTWPGMDRGQLEAKVIAGARARAAAPTGCLGGAARHGAGGDRHADHGGEGPGRRARTRLSTTRRRKCSPASAAELEARNEEYEAWSDSTAGTRDIAGKAQKELERRGHQVPEWTPEEEQPETETAEPERRARAGG